MPASVNCSKRNISKTNAIRSCRTTRESRGGFGIHPLLQSLDHDDERTKESRPGKFEMELAGKNLKTPGKVYIMLNERSEKLRDR
jgi:hypothetical protein